MSTSRLPVPVAQLGSRLPEAGRIRMGVKSGRAMKSIDTFRFTSPFPDLITQIAAIYGGDARRWHDDKANPPDQWEVITTSNQVRVFLPLEPLSVWYEQWSGGGVTRRCDGIECEVPGRDGMESRPCLCIEQEVMGCRPYTRLTVILPDISFAGGWRMETKGWNAAHEMPMMTDVIRQLQAMGIVEAQLRLDQESQMQGGKKKHFVVPRLQVDTSPLRMLEGAAAVQALGKAGIEAKELPPGDPEAGRLLVTPQVVDADREWFEEDEPDELQLVHPNPAPALPDDIEDAVVVEDLPPASDPDPGEPVDIERRRQTRLVLVCNEVAAGASLNATELRHAVAWWASKHEKESSKDLTPEERQRALDALDAAAKEQSAGYPSARALLKAFDERTF